MSGFRNNQPRRNRHSMQWQVGFSLVEMSIVLVIVGFIAASALSVAISSDYTTRRDETEAKMLRIDEALAGYLATNYRLPCPADGTLLISHANFGLEVAGGGNRAAAPTCTLNNFSDASVRGGVVPVRTLQLPDDYMFDGWGRRIDYAVDINFANNSVTNPAACLGTAGNACFRDMTAGSITVNAAAGGRTANAVYVTYSHGENGHGAFTKNGSATRINGFPSGNPYGNTTASADEYTNAKFDNTSGGGAGAATAYSGTFVMREYTRNDDTSALATARTYFDDIIHYKTKSQLVKDAGASIFESACLTASTIIDTPGANSCTGATDNTQCETFAAFVNDGCLRF